MASPSQQTLPLKPCAPRKVRRPVAVATRTSQDQPVRWGSAVMTPERGRQAIVEKHLTVGPRAPRRTPVWSPEELVRVEQDIRARHGQRDSRVPMGRQEAPEDGGAFAQSRIRHAFELFGACMMIAGFLALAMFA